MASERGLPATRIVRVVEVVIPLWVRAEGRVVDVRRQYQRRTAPPTADQFRGDKFLFLRVSTRLKEAIERADARLILAKAHISPVATEYFRLRHRQGEPGFTRIAQDELAGLLEPGDVYRVVSGCSWIYFGMSMSAGYLEATVTMAAVAREAGVNALVNMSQMTVSEMSIQKTTPSHQQRQHWLGEQALAWSGLPVVTIRPTMFLESFFQLANPSIRDRDRIELPFGRGKTSPVAGADVAQVVAAVLADAIPHRIYELTGPQSQDMDGIAREFSDALNREITYYDISPEEWEQKVRRLGMPELLTGHLLAMGELHRAGRYDRQTDGVQRVTGRR